ncbi:hypothetical protein TNCV_4748121 [Trichonephila clavipes]|nr:hypothetical protein TNCV_4748121 [Trichonephila clavipes]
MIPFIKRFSYLHLKNLDDLQPDETEVKGIVPSPRYNLRARAEEEFLGVSLTPPKRVTHFPRLEEGNVPINTSWYGMFLGISRVLGSHGPREDITPLTPDQSEKLIVLRKRILSEYRSAFHLSSSTTILMRGLAARQLFRVAPCRKSTIHLQTSMSSPGFEPKPNGTAVSVVNHYIGWATENI